MDRAIIHLNIADFAVAVETNLQPSLKGYPVVVAPLGAPRAVVYDMSEQAFQQGIHKGMPLARARRLNKKIQVLPPCFNRYEKVMKALLKESTAFTPQIESGSLDGHLFMDVTGSSRLFGPPVDMAFKLKKTFQKAFNLDPIWSVATSKLVAKVATRVVKPAGEYIVAPGDEEQFLAPLPLHLIPGLNPSDIRQLSEFNLFQVAQARKLTVKQLEIPFSQRAAMIYTRIRGIDPEPVNSLSDTGSCLTADHEFADDTNHGDLLKKALYILVEKICAALRQQKLHSAAARLTLSFSDGLQREARQKLSTPTACDMTLFRQCTGLLEKAWTRRVRIRYMRLACEKRPAKTVQADLFSKQDKESRQSEIIKAMDHIRKKFGPKAVRTGLTLIKE